MLSYTAKHILITFMHLKFLSLWQHIFFFYENLLPLKQNGRSSEKKQIHKICKKTSFDNQCIFFRKIQMASGMSTNT